MPLQRENIRKCYARGVRFGRDLDKFKSLAVPAVSWRRKASFFQLKPLPPDALWASHLHDSPSSKLIPSSIHLFNKFF